MIYVLYTIHVVICLFLILVVLLQQGKGADLSVFGGGSTQAAFGARGAATILHKMTVAGFVGFILTTMAIGFLQTGSSQSSVMRTVEEAAEPVPVPTTDAGMAVEEAVGRRSSFRGGPAARRAVGLLGLPARQETSAVVPRSC